MGVTLFCWQFFLAAHIFIFFALWHFEQEKWEKVKVCPNLPLSFLRPVEIHNLLNKMIFFIIIIIVVNLETLTCKHIAIFYFNLDQALFNSIFNRIEFVWF